MALITRYVNTGSTSGGDGTTNATTGANRAYHTLAAAEAGEEAIRGDLVFDGDSLEILCSGSTADTTISPFAGWTTSASNTITIKPHPDDLNTTGIFDTSKYNRTCVNAWNQSIYVQVGWTYIEGLQISVTASNASAVRAAVVGSVETVVDGCIIKGTDTASQTGISIGAAGTSISRAINNVVYDLAGYGIRNQAYTTGGEITVYNNTIDNCLNGLHLSSNGASVDVRLINNLLTNNGTDYTSTTTPDFTDNNVTSDATGPDAGHTSKTITYTDAAGGDFSTSDTDIVGLGTDLTSDSTYAFSTDIIGEDRGTSWDIGAFQVAAGGSYTLATDSGTYTLTGTANSLILDALLSGNSGTYAYTGTAADLVTGYGLQADSGSYAYSGTAATLLADKLIAADTGSYTYTGTAASLTRDGALAADTGAYTYTGTEVALTFASAGSFTLTALTGAYSVSGTNADLLHAATLGADSGSYSYTGTAVDFTSGYGLTADSGSYSYTGTDVTLSTLAILSADSGSYTYGGSNVILRASGQVWTVEADTVTTWTDQADSSTIWNIQ